MPGFFAGRRVRPPARLLSAEPPTPLARLGARRTTRSERSALQNPVSELVEVLEPDCNMPEEVDERLLGRWLVGELDGRQRPPPVKHTPDG